MSDINVVPYIDVMLVLLVIFMITAPLLTQGVRVELPQADAEPLSVESEEPLVVTVDQAGETYIDVGEGKDRPVDSETLISRIRSVLKHRPDTAVMVRGDQHVEYGRVVEAMVTIQEAGVPTVGLITEAPEALR